MKDFVVGIIAILLGFILMIVGTFSLFQFHPQPQITDEQIIERARELGMVPLKEALEIKE